MDAQAKKKASFRAKLNALKQEKRIDSPLVRYNEHDQPVCRVCDVVLKSESLWPAHQASRKHHEAINNLKANAAAVSRASNVKAEPPKEIPKSKPEISDTSNSNRPEPSTRSTKPQSSSMLPPDFFDNQESKRLKKDVDSSRTGNPGTQKNAPISSEAQEEELFISGSKIDGLSTAITKESRNSDSQPSKDNRQMSKTTAASEAKQVKGALPEGFFDDKDADLRARGITPVKPDVKDEYKEFEKLIQEDLQEVDNRLEEEEIDAAEMIEESETVEQRAYRERVELLRRKKLELKAARAAVQAKGTRVPAKESSQEESSSDDDSNENLTFDWRAKHL